MFLFSFFISLTYLLMPVFHRRTRSGRADFPHPARQAIDSLNEHGSRAPEATGKPEVSPACAPK